MRNNEKDGLSDLFRSRLGDAELPVREGGWESLQADLAQVADTPSVALLPLWRRWPLRRIAAAASVLLLLGGASAAFWWLTPQMEVEDPLPTYLSVQTPATIHHDGVQREEFATNSATVYPVQRNIVPLSSGAQAALYEAEEEERGVVSVRLSITVSQLTGAGSWNARSRQPMPSRYVLSARDVWEVADRCATPPSRQSAEAPSHASRWAWKVGIGSSLPQGEHHMPLQARISVERSLSDRWAIEAGLQYNRFSQQGAAAIHSLSLPVKMQMRLTPEAPAELYASVGGAIEKCIAGAPDNSFQAEPLQLSASAGIGIRYRLNDRLALYAEPELTHRFSTRSTTRTLATERPTNLSLMCGVRLNY